MRRSFSASSLSTWLPVTSLLLITALAGLLRLWDLAYTPPGFHFDESFEGLEAWRILTDSDYRPIFLRGNFGVPVAFAYLSAGMFWLFEQFGAPAGPLPMRTVAALVGTISVPVVVGLTRELSHYGLLPRRAAQVPLLFAALAAAAALAGMRWHVHFSRMGIEPILGPLLWAGALWTLLRAIRVQSAARLQSWILYAAAGLFTAAAMYTYQAIWILPFIVAAAAMTALWHGASSPDFAGWRTKIPGLLLAGGLALLLVLPLLLLFLREPALVFTRPTQVIAGEGNDRTLLQNTLASLGMFVPFGVGDLDPRRNLPGEPALHWLWSIPFWAGVYVGLRHFRQPAWIILWISWLGLLLPGIVTEYAPHYHRILAAAGPTAVFMGAGAWQLAAWLARGLSALRASLPAQAISTVCIALLLVGGTVWDAHLYFNRWGPRADLYHAFDEGLWDVGQWAAEQSEQTIFISPRGSEHTTLAFAWRNLSTAGTGMPISYDGRHILPIVTATDSNSQGSLYIVIEHEDFRSGLLLPSVFPNLTPLHQFRDRAGDPYATIWHRPGDTPSHRGPAYPLPANTGNLTDGIALLGHDLLPETLHPGGIAYVQLHWQTTTAPTRDWTVFLHILPTAGDTTQVLAQHDAQPGQGTLPTARWATGWTILDEHQIQLPSDLPPGDYQLRVGLYPTGNPQGDAPTPLDLGAITVEARP